MLKETLIFVVVVTKKKQKFIFIAFQKKLPLALVNAGNETFGGNFNCGLPGGVKESSLTAATFAGSFGFFVSIETFVVGIRTT